MKSALEERRMSEVPSRKAADVDGGRPNLICAKSVVTKWRSEELHASERALHVVLSKDELQQWFLEDATIVARCSTRVTLVMRLLGGIATPRQDVGLHVCKPRR